MNKKILLFLILGGVATSTFVMARMFRPAQVPNGTVKSCLTCHVTPGGDRNAFGREVERNFLSTPGSAGNVQWGPALAQLDSDGDGFTNGQELQDPAGTWVIGQADPGNPALVTSPGDPNDFPNTTSVEALPGIAAGFGLEKNYPNPFNPSTTIMFSVPRSVRAHIGIYSVSGQLVRTLLNDDLQAGRYTSVWNGRDDAGMQVASGRYLYRLSAGDFTATRTMVMLK